MDNLRFALFGLGGFGTHYARLLQATEGAVLKTVITSSSAPPTQSQEHVLRPDVRSTHDADAAWNDPEIDCVAIATPASTHFDIVKNALEHKKHVLVEKPMTASVAEALQLAQAVKKSGAIFMVGFTYIYNDYIRFLKKSIESGALGTMRAMRAEHRHTPSRPDVNSFWDAAPHPLSIFNYLFNPTRLVEIQREVATREYTSVTLRFDRGPLLSIITLSGTEKKVRKLTFEGDRQTATLDETKETEKLRFSLDGAISLTPLTEPLRNEIEYFMRCVREQQTPITDIQCGLRITEWLEAISPPQ